VRQGTIYCRGGTTPEDIFSRILRSALAIELAAGPVPAVFAPARQLAAAQLSATAAAVIRAVVVFRLVAFGDLIEDHRSEDAGGNATRDLAAVVLSTMVFSAMMLSAMMRRPFWLAEAATTSTTSAFVPALGRYVACLGENETETNREYGCGTEQGFHGV
jgi:hypothetical protein